MKNIKISVIVSVYNTEKYISTCLNSLLNQTYSNLEFIIIDDGSQDNSWNILKEYELKDKRVVLFQNKKNCGLAYSRNLGVKKASGEYFSFIDSDDYIDLNYYEKLMQNVYEYHADIVVCDIHSVYENTGTILKNPGCVGDTKNLFSFIHTGLSASACNKLIHRSLFEHNFFPEGKINEDLPVIIPCMVRARCITYQPETHYYYIQRDSSIQNSNFSMKKFDIFEMLELTLKRIEGCNDFERIRDSLIFYQIILLLFYEFIKIPNFMKRISFLKQYDLKSKPYHLLSNPFLSDFYQNTGKKTGLFYQALLRFTTYRFYFFSSLLISFSQFYKKKFGKVVLLDYSFQDLEHLAKKNAKLKESKIKISVVIPNYNYAKFLNQRVGSILSQRKKIHEIIFLDDCSKDNSKEVIDKIIDKISPYISVFKIYNNKNSGSAFCQWEKGFSKAKGDYVWICEADDYCTENLLSHLIKPIQKHPDVMISYCDTAMIDTFGNLIQSSVKNDIDLQKTGHWRHSYLNEGQKEIQDYAYLNCTIANVSSALIKKENYQSYFDLSKQYKQAGDWLFYLNVMNRGKVAFCKEVCNYYRIHGNNVTSVTKKQAHFDEIQKIHLYVREHFSLSDDQEKKIKERYSYLREVWNLARK